MGPRQRLHAARDSCYLVEGLTPRHGGPSAMTCLGVAPRPSACLGTVPRPSAMPSHGASA